MRPEDQHDPKTILVVEDEQAVRNLVTSALRTEGYQLLVAQSAEEALAVAGAHPTGIDLLLTDARMPGMGGLELAVQMIASRPRLRIIIMSGDAHWMDGAAFHIEHLPKPFTPRDLRRRIKEVLSLEF